MSHPRILVIDDDADVLLALDMLLREKGYITITDTDPGNIPSLMRGEGFDAVFLDMNFTGEARDGREGLSWLKEILRLDPDAMVIPITAFGDVDLAVKAIKEGSADFILKPWKNEKLLSTLSMVLTLRESKLDLRRLQLQQRQLLSDMDRKSGEMIGSSPAMRDVLRLIRKVAPTDANVLILGENGTGKELVARALHRLSGRSERVFIGVDMGSIPESLFESELFGHAKGAFTDAKEARVGRFENASGGSLFLDEVGNLSLQAQAKLLRAIEGGEITPVGSNRSRPIDTRLICATNMPIYEMVARREFRQDLLYRINTIEIQLPPLRERKEDIPALVEYFASQYYRKYKIPRKEIPRETLARLDAYDWPGNIRELKHAIERAVIVGESKALRPEDFPLRGGSARGAEPSGAEAPPEESNLESVERSTIRRSLMKSGGNISRSAAELGLTRAALYRRIAKYGLQKLSD
jgi:two-component system, NtrC family, response regulator HydG